MVRNKNSYKLGFFQRVTTFFERGVISPFLFSIQPVVQLFLINVNELDFSEIIRALLVAFLLALIIYWMLYLFLRDMLRASLIASPFLVVFFLFRD
ncbi:MAG TPA: hypothetical protein VJ972_10775, partial [Anaerolineales bacterium]|nr:hypothetical protein [Anaerolineales bacterium]